MAHFGLGFSQQEVNRRCRTVLYKDRYKNSKFKNLGNAVVRRMKVVKSMENVEEEDEEEAGAVGRVHDRSKAVTIIIGGKTREFRV